MRLTFIIRDLGHGGAQRQLTTLVAGLKRAGHEVCVLHFYGGPFEPLLREAGVQTVCVAKKGRWDLLGFFMRLVRAARATRPDVLHGYMAEANLMALFLKPLAGGPKVAWGVRDSQSDAHLWGVLGRLSFRLNCLLARFVDVIICNSQAGRDYYAARGYPTERMHVVPNGIDTDRFQPSQAAPRNVRVFGLVGRLSPMKDHATFLRAAAQVPNARFIIAGNGDDAYAEKMRLLAEELQVSERVSWLPAQEDMPTLYAQMDCLVNSSAFGEGFSNVIAEAMACGVPCVASDVGDSAWLVGETGRIFPAGDAEALAKLMREFTPSADTRPRERVVGEFSVQRLVQRTESLLAPKVLWLTTGLGSGGAEMMLAQLVTTVSSFQHAVVSLTAGGKHADALKSAGVEVHSLDMPAGKPSLASLWRLRKVLKRTRPDLLVGWMYHGCLAAVLARCLHLRGVPQLWNVRQSLYDLKLEKRGSARVIRLLAALSWVPARITYNSKVSATQHEAIGYRSSQTQLIPNGFDLAKWQPLSPHEQEAKRRELAQMQPDVEECQAFYIGRFGRYAAMKDYETFLTAAQLIHDRHPEARFIIVGAGTEDLKVPSYVQVLGERHDLPELTGALNVAVSSSAFGEGFPNVVGEAMACAVPVVATDVGDTRWLMGDTGHVVKPQDPLALANACIGILEAGIQRDEAARRRIEEHFSLQSVAQQFEHLFQEALGHTPLSPTRANSHAAQFAAPLSTLPLS